MEHQSNTGDGKGLWLAYETVLSFMGEMDKKLRSHAIHQGRYSDRARWSLFFFSFSFTMDRLLQITSKNQTMFLMECWPQLNLALRTLGKNRNWYRNMFFLWRHLALFWGLIDCYDAVLNIQFAFIPQIKSKYISTEGEVCSRSLGLHVPIALLESNGR